MTMDIIKVEVDEDYWALEDELSWSNSCFICLQSVPSTNEQISSLNSLLNYLKVKEVEAVVCEKCGENLTKFEKLCKALEKVRMELDYFLEIIGKTILNSSKNSGSGRESSVLDSVRDSVAKNCKENIYKRPKVILQRLDLSKLIKTRSQSPTWDCSDDWSPSLDDVEDSIDNRKWKRSTSGKRAKCTKCSKTFYNSTYLKRHDAAVHRQSFKCSTCLKTFAGTQSLRIHINAVHLNLKPHKCDNCGRAFGRLGEFLSHKSAKKSCKEKIKERAEIEILRRQTHCVDNFDKDIASSTDSDHRDQSKTGAPVIAEIENSEADILENVTSTKCTKCSKTFSNKYYLKVHIDRVHLKPFKCSQCPTAFASEKKLQVHINAVHLPQEPFKCSQYLKSFTKKNTLLVHIDAVHLGLKPHKCDKCDMSFGYISALNVHKAKYHPSSDGTENDEKNDGIRKPISTIAAKCTDCSRTFPNKYQLKTHYDSFHLGIKSFKCSQCPKSFTIKSTLLVHMNAVHLRLKPNQCERCGMSFGYPSALRVHIAKYHNGNQPPPPSTPTADDGLQNGSLSKRRIKCTKCSKEFRDKHYLKRHINAVHRRKLFKCLTCQKPFSVSQNLRHHIDSVHLRLKPFMCELCGRSFARLEYLQRHKATPHNQGPKPFPCEKCDKSFDKKLLLKKHSTEVHSGRRFPCDICKKIFKTRIQLRTHVSSVHEKRRHFCQVQGCNKSYSLPPALANHYKTNHPDCTLKEKKVSAYLGKFTVVNENGESVVECKFCQKQFRNVDLIRSHIRRVHGPKSFLCAECGYASATSCGLKRHVKLMHKSGHLQGNEDD